MLKYGLCLSGRAARGCRRGIIAGNATSLQQQLLAFSACNGKFRMEFICLTLRSRSVPNRFSTLSTVTGITGPKKFEAASEGNSSGDDGIFARSIHKLEKHLSTKQNILEKEEVAILEELKDLFSEVLDNRTADGVTAYLEPVFTLLENGKNSNGKGGTSGVVGVLQHVENRLQITLKEFTADFALIGSKDSSLYSEDVRLRAQAAVRLAFAKAYCIQLRKSHSRGELRDGITGPNVMETVAIMLQGGPKERFSHQFSLFDRNGDGWLTYSEIDLAFNSITEPVQAALVELHPQILALPKKAPRRAADRPLRFAYWDTLQLPSRCRCVYTWTSNKKQTGPDEYRVSFDAFWEMVEKYFAEDIGCVAKKLCTELLSQRRMWHDRRKMRKRIVVYGVAFFVSVIVLDNLSSMM